MPPPAITTLKTFGQWSRPAVALIFGVRPHHIHLTSESVEDQYKGSVVLYESLGEEGVLELEIEGSSALVQTASDLSFTSGENVSFTFDWKNVIFFDTMREQAIDFDR